MKKILLAILFSLVPPLFVIATTPISSLSEHISHIVLFAILGLAMGLFSLKSKIKVTTVKPRKVSLLPIFSTTVLSVALIFAITHLMPCPYMFSPHSAQMMIDHPCSQPLPACTPIFSFAISQTSMIPSVLPFPHTSAVEPIQTTHNRAPPLV